MESLAPGTEQANCEANRAGLDRGLRCCMKVLIVPPLPAASRPSNRMTIRSLASRNITLL